MNLFGNKYPYTNFHEMNLDWIIDEIKKIHAEWSEFQIINQIVFDGPWDITKPYKKWTLVNYQNNGYLSKDAVPAGIPITDGNYWTLVADYSALLADMQNRIIALENTTAVIDDKINKINNVKLYGAVGDGIADDTQAINDCISENGCAYFPKGIYLISDTIMLVDNLSLVGDNAVLKLANYTNKIMLSGDTVINVIIDGIHLDQGTQSTQTEVIKLTQSTSIIFNNVVVDKQYGTTYTNYGMIDCIDCTEISFINCKLSNAAAEGLWMHNCNNCIINGGEFKDCPNGSGIAVGGDYNRVSNVYAHDTGGSNAIVSGKYNVVDNCIFENSTQSNGLSFGHYPDVVVGGCVSNCVVKDFKVIGIAISQGTNVVISNCQIDGNAYKSNTAQYAISHNNLGGTADISNCNINNCYYGIAAYAGDCVNNCTVANCVTGIRIYDNSHVDNCYVYNCTLRGISFETASKASATNCKVINCVAGIVADNRQSDITISDCMIRSCSSVGIRINAANTVVNRNDLRNLDNLQPIGLNYVGTDSGYAFDNIAKGCTNNIASAVVQNNNILV